MAFLEKGLSAERLTLSFFQIGQNEAIPRFDVGSLGTTED
jgi:hypothetical protein